MKARNIIKIDFTNRSCRKKNNISYFTNVLGQALRRQQWTRQTGKNLHSWTNEAKAIAKEMKTILFKEWEKEEKKEGKKDKKKVHILSSNQI